MIFQQLSRCFAFSAPLVLSAFFGVGQPSRVSAQGIFANEPIAFTGHGALFGPGGNEISPTAKFLSDALTWYLDELTKNLSAERVMQFEEKRKSVVDGLTLDEQSRLIVQTRLIDWLLDQTARRDADRIRGKIRIIEGVLSKQLTNHVSNRFPGGTQAFALSPELARRLSTLRTDAVQHNLMAIPSLLDVTINTGEEYRKECASKGVPLPPNFGPGSGWEDRGTIPKSELFYCSRGRREGSNLDQLFTERNLHRPPEVQRKQHCAS
jgi:hypothetical protein